jgi:putative zinc finger/helix-turn-helix YgiT family protein
MKANQNNIPPVCPRCDSEGTFQERECDVEQLFRNETLSVQAACAECSACGFRILLRGQTDALRQRTADAYRAKHGLLTSAEIRGRRTSRGLSQKDFAGLVGVGIASIKRWENCGVQDQSNDKLLRQVTNAGTQPPAAVFDMGHLSFSWNVGSDIRVPKSAYVFGTILTGCSNLSEKAWSLPPFTPTPQPKPKRSPSDADFALAA